MNDCGWYKAILTLHVADPQTPISVRALHEATGIKTVAHLQANLEAVRDGNLEGFDAVPSIKINYDMSISNRPTQEDRDELQEEMLAMMPA